MTHSATSTVSGGAYREGRAHGPRHLPRPPAAAPPWPLRGRSSARGAEPRQQHPHTARAHRAPCSRRAPAPPIGRPAVPPPAPSDSRRGQSRGVLERRLSRAARRVRCAALLEGSRQQGPAAGPGRARESDVGAAAHHAQWAQQRLVLRDQPVPGPALPGAPGAAGGRAGPGRGGLRPGQGRARSRAAGGYGAVGAGRRAR